MAERPEGQVQKVTGSGDGDCLHGAGRSGEELRQSDRSQPDVESCSNLNANGGSQAGTSSGKHGPRHNIEVIWPRNCDQRCRGQ